MKYLYLIFNFIIFEIQADSIQFKLLQIAEEEAYIANIGKNKLSMLYGIENPIPLINRWNSLQNKKPLTREQVKKINALEKQKQIFLQQVKK